MGNLRILFTGLLLLYAISTNAADPRTEVKFPVAPQHAESTMDKLDLDRRAAKAVTIWFFDTDDLQLREKNLYLRVRASHTGKREVTLKIRPYDLEQDLLKVRKNNFKLEYDDVGNRTLLSASISSLFERRELSRVLRDDESIYSLLSKSQRETLEQMLGTKKLQLRPLGPVTSFEWTKSTTKELGTLSSSIEIEQWNFPGLSHPFLEISMKVNSSDAFRCRQLLTAFGRQQALSFRTGLLKTEALFEVFAANAH